MSENTLFAKAREKFGTAQINWLTASFRVVALDQDDPVDPETAEFLSDIPASYRIGTSDLLADKSVLNGYLMASPTRFPTPPQGVVRSLAIYIDTGTPSTSTLIALIREARSMPVPNTNRVVSVAWQVGGKGVLRI